MKINKKSLIYIVIVLIAAIILVFILKANKICVVTFDTRGGTIYASENVKCGQRVTKPADPELEGYEFISWLDPETNKEFDFNSYINKDITIKAHYQKIN